jgi:hypothetical protein
VEISSQGINYVAVVVAGLTGFPLGFLWYGPLFEAPWMRALGKTRDTITPPPPSHWALIAFGSLLSALTIALVTGWAGADSAVDGVLAGLVLGVGLIVTESFKLFVYEGRTVTLLAINNGYTLVHYAIMGAILGAWR